MILKAEIKQKFATFASPFVNKARNECLKADVFYIYFNWNYSTHFFDRLESREIDKGQVGSVFKKLVDEYLCRLLFSLESCSYENTMKGETNLHVYYKDIVIPFGVNKMNNHYRLTPKTILSSAMKVVSKSSHVIDIDMNVNEFRIIEGSVRGDKQT